MALESCRKARDVLGWEPQVELRDGLERRLTGLDGALRLHETWSGRVTSVGAGAAPMLMMSSPAQAKIKFENLTAKCQLFNLDVQITCFYRFVAYHILLKIKSNKCYSIDTKIPQSFKIMNL